MGVSGGVRVLGAEGAMGWDGIVLGINAICTDLGPQCLQ